MTIAIASAIKLQGAIRTGILETAATNRRLSADLPAMLARKNVPSHGLVDLFKKSYACAEAQAEQLESLITDYFDTKSLVAELREWSQ